MLERFLERSPLTHLHVFPYSDRPGTAASRMREEGRRARVVRERAQRIRHISEELAKRFRAGQVGTRASRLTLDDGSTVVTGNYLKLRVPRRVGRNEWVNIRVTSEVHGELADRVTCADLRRSAVRTPRECRGPGSSCTETVRSALGEDSRERITASSDGREKAIPAASFSGIRFTFDLTPASTVASRRASSSESLTPASRTYSKVMRLRFRTGNRLHAATMSATP